MMIENEMQDALSRGVDDVVRAHYGDIADCDDFLRYAAKDAPGIAAWLEADGEDPWIGDKQEFVEAAIWSFENQMGADGAYAGDWSEYWQRTADLDF